MVNDLKVATAPFGQQKIIFRCKHNWLMTVLYVGTFGSFGGGGAGGSPEAGGDGVRSGDRLQRLDRGLRLFFIPAMFASFAVTASLWVFVVYYALCLGVCWWFYARPGAEAPS